MFGHLGTRISKAFNQVRKKRNPLPQVPNVDDKRFLFIGGLHRSGTSILHRTLCEHPLASGFDDTGVAEDEGQHLQTVFRAAHEFGGAGEFAFHLEAHMTEDSTLINQDNRNKLLREWGAYYDLQKSVLLEKSPPNLVRSRFLRKMFPASVFVFIVRHPVAVSLATEKWSKKTITERLLHWQAAHSIMLDDISTLDNCLVIRYEDFVAEPGSYLDVICDCAGMHRFEPTAKVRDHNQHYFQDWMQRYAADIRAIQAVLPSDNTVLKYFDYSLCEPFVGNAWAGNPLRQSGREAEGKAYGSDLKAEGGTEPAG